MIPAMTDPRGEHWTQPHDIRDAPMDDVTVLLTPEQAEGLCEYSTSFPTGVYPGKCWRREERTGYFLGWYGETDDPGRCSINWRKIEVVSPAGSGPECRR